MLASLAATVRAATVCAAYFSAHWFAAMIANFGSAAQFARDRMRERTIINKHAHRFLQKRIFTNVSTAKAA